MNIKQMCKEIIGKPLNGWKKSDESYVLKDISSLDIGIVGKCNLNCRSCSVFSPLEEDGVYPIELFQKDIRQMSVLFKDAVRRINLLGGEPLLNPQISEYMLCTRKYFPKTRIVIVSNGILLCNMPNSFWNVAKENSIELEVTKYPIGLDFKKMKKIAKNNQVKFSYFGRSGYVEKTQYYLPLDVSGSKKIEYSYYHCFMAKHCISLSQGRLYPCSVAAYLFRFNKYFGTNMNITEKDYGNIYTESKEKILSKLSHPLPVCRYCDVERRSYGNKWDYSNRKKCEWN